jgi:hypothetical protein
VPPNARFLPDGESAQAQNSGPPFRSTCWTRPLGRNQQPNDSVHGRSPCLCTLSSTRNLNNKPRALAEQPLGPFLKDSWWGADFPWKGPVERSFGQDKGRGKSPVLCLYGLPDDSGSMRCFGRRVAAQLTLMVLVVLSIVAVFNVPGPLMSLAKLVVDVSPVPVTLPRQAERVLVAPL